MVGSTTQVVTNCARRTAATLGVVLVVGLMHKRHITVPSIHGLGVDKSSLWRPVGHAFVLNLEPLVADLESIHLLDSELSAHDGIVGDKSKTLGFSSVPIHKHFGADDIAEGIECSGKVCIC